MAAFGGEESADREDHLTLVAGRTGSDGRNQHLAAPVPQPGDPRCAVARVGHETVVAVEPGQAPTRSGEQRDPFEQLGEGPAAE